MCCSVPVVSCAGVAAENKHARKVKAALRAESILGGPLRMTLPCSLVRSASHLHHFRFLAVRHLFHAADLFIRHLLHLFHGALLFVLADLLILSEFFKGIVAVAADVADRGAMFFE